MHWYATLTDKKNLMVQDYLDYVHGSVLSMDNEVDNEGDSCLCYKVHHF